jgi:hypothetical protein
MKPVVMMTWTESESGWGQRCDGATLHLSQDDLTAYIDAYWKREKERNTSGGVPDEYSRPDGDIGKIVLVDDELYDEVKATEHGRVLWQTEFSTMTRQNRIVTVLNSRAVAEMAAEPENFVGIVERNDWEGEVFGYYWERTPEACETLKKIESRYRQEGDISMRFELMTEKLLRELAGADRNSHRRRVTIYEAPENWGEFLEKIAPASQKITDDEINPFYKGRGLPKTMERPPW